MNLSFVMITFRNLLCHSQFSNTQAHAVARSRLFASSKSIPAPSFPPWLRMRVLADFSQRQATTTHVSEAISRSGGFLSNANMLSDMVTSMLIEDIEPLRLDQFRESLERIDGLTLTNTTKDLFDSCHEQVKDAQQMEVSLPEPVAGMLQITWRNAPGKLQQTIVADG